MPKISGDSLATHKAETRRRILESFGDLLFRHGLHSLTMAQVASTAGVGRTALYNYFSDKEQLLVAYTLAETGRYLSELRRELRALDNPIDQLAAYVRAQLHDLGARHVPPGPAVRTLMSAESFAAFTSHVSELEELLCRILTAGMRDSYLPDDDPAALARLVMSTITTQGSTPHDDVEGTVRFVQRGVGAILDDRGRPVRPAEHGWHEWPHARPRPSSRC